MSEPLTPPVLGSMKQCQAIYGIPVSVQKAAKSAGCHAFDDHARVRPELLTQFLFKEGNEELSSKGPALERLNAARAAREEIRLGKDRERMADKGEVITAINRGTAMLANELDKLCKVNLPPALVGLTAPQICDVLTKAIVDGVWPTAKAEFQKMGEESK